MDEDWPETPSSRRLHAKVYDRTSGRWTRKQIRDIKAGDVFQTYLRGVLYGLGQPNPPSELNTAVAVSDAERNYRAGEGWGVACDWGALDDLIRNRSLS